MVVEGRNFVKRGTKHSTSIVNSARVDRPCGQSWTVLLCCIGLEKDRERTHLHRHGVILVHHNRCVSMLAARKTRGSRQTKKRKEKRTSAYYSLQAGMGKSLLLPRPSRGETAASPCELQGSGRGQPSISVSRRACPP